MSFSTFGSGFLDFVSFCFGSLDPEHNFFQFVFLFILVIGFISIFISMFKERS